MDTLASVSLGGQVDCASMWKMPALSIPVTARMEPRVSTSASPIRFHSTSAGVPRVTQGFCVRRKLMTALQTHASTEDSAMITLDIMIVAAPLVS
ncbi:hypothetical protein scyTo_0013694 [Scyliorhinus torazame]|uniref:Uncharacterized protein n=1 Tax=Scyliorhinus torazame TaxID=75743 RepID=A0A401P2L6_SCYTO|nr:hypothetical protein [Scyliorhinus torazame]